MTDEIGHLNNLPGQAWPKDARRLFTNHLFLRYINFFSGDAIGEGIFILSVKDSNCRRLLVSDNFQKLASLFKPFRYILVAHGELRRPDRCPVAPDRNNRPCNGKDQEQKNPQHRLQPLVCFRESLLL